MMASLVRKAWTTVHIMPRAADARPLRIGGAAPWHTAFWPLPFGAKKGLVKQGTLALAWVGRKNWSANVVTEWLRYGCTSLTWVANAVLGGNFFRVRMPRRPSRPPHAGPWPCWAFADFPFAESRNRPIVKRGVPIGCSPLSASYHRGIHGPWCDDRVKVTVASV